MIMPPRPTSDRSARHDAIARLVRSRRVQSQSELQGLLRTSGVDANQATLSRDLRELGATKGPDGYALPGAGEPAGADELTRMARQWLQSATAAGNLVVLRTPPAGSQPLAIAIDREPPPEVVGTLGGDDTVLVICPDEQAARRFAADLEERRR